jgi:dTDP-4-dehydrorhamnose reductase
MRRTNMKIAITGASGQVGGELCRQIGRQAIPLDIGTLDLTDAKAVMETLLPLRPELIINCAAYTQVDQAEKEPELAHAANASAVENLAAACRKLDCPLVQISTDYVFGGDRIQSSGLGVREYGDSPVKPRPSVAHGKRPYREDDPPAPQCVYARTKLEGERAAAELDKHLIIRTCGLYARPSDNQSHNFVKTMLHLGSAQDEIRVVADQHCTPSYVPHVARAILFLAGIRQAPAPWGIYHVTNAGETTWCEFAVEIFKQAGLDVKVIPITTAEYGAPAPRPLYSVLDTTAYHRLGGPAMPDWKAALQEYFREWRELKNEQ